MRFVRMTLAEVPDLASQWHPARNRDLTPSRVMSQSNMRVWWQCGQGHDYEAVVANRVVLGRGCPYCARKRAGYGNDLASEFPDIAAEWHSDRNGALTPAQVLAGSGRKVWWQCPAGHDYEATVNKRVGGSTGCPFCAGRRAGHGNDLATLHPAVAAEWHRDRNGALTPSQVVPGSGRKVWWQCPAGHDYDMAVFRRARQGIRCPYCFGRRAGQGNDLATLNPDIAGQWHPTRNAMLTPADVRPMSNRTVWWRCDQGHDYEAMVCNRVGNGDGCPYCSGQRVGYGNDLSRLFPAVASEWHPTCNGTLRPGDVRPKSHRSVWWRCSRCDHQWQAVISSRTSGKGCPACGVERNSAARRQPAAGRSLADEHPDLAAEWHPGLNGARTPDAVNSGSSDRAWWKCHYGHTWNAIISNRTKRQGGSNCPHCCLATTSKMEIRIFAELQHVLAGYLGPIEHNPRLPALPGRKLAVDMSLGDVIIEFDSAYWHADGLLRDAAKTARLVAAGYRVIRIRESPLSRLTDHDVLVPAHQSAHLTAVAVLEAMDRWGWLPIQARPAMRVYIERGAAMAEHIANSMIEPRLVPSQ